MIVNTVTNNVPRYDDEQAQLHAEYLESLSRCPACGDYMDYCQGHGDLGDPDGAAILAEHDNDEHGNCHPKSDCVVADYDPYDEY